VTGDTWYDEVRAHPQPGNESAGTMDRAVTTTDRRAPAVPQGPAVTTPPRGADSGPAGARSWERPRHEVSRATSENGSSGSVGSTEQVPYRDATAEQGVTYY
jgi:hypothetical protein